jgi:hypothetical protein
MARADAPSVTGLNGPTLVIDAPEALALAARIPGDGLVIARFPTLDGDLLARVRPARIIAPLFGRGFDATNVLIRLERLVYVGLIVIAAPRLPDRHMVERELVALTPGLRIELQMLP